MVDANAERTRRG